MIEIHNLAGTKSLGCCRNLKEAQPVLDDLAQRGEIPQPEAGVTCCHFKSGKLRQVTTVAYRNNKWRIVKNS